MVQGPLTGSTVCPVVVQSLLVLPTLVSSRPSRRDLVLNKGHGSRVFRVSDIELERHTF